MNPIATHPLSRLTTGTINPDGVDLVIAAAGVDLPEVGHGSYKVALHNDGAPCPPECGCVDAEDRTVIWEDTTIARGEWTWHGSRYALIGWHSVGPTKPELHKRVDELVERAEVLAEDLEAERGNHRVTNADLIRNINAVERLTGQRDEALGWLGDAEAAHLDTKEALGTYRKAAAGAAVVALLLAAALVWAVIV